MADYPTGLIPPLLKTAVSLFRLRCLITVWERHRRFPSRTREQVVSRWERGLIASLIDGGLARDPADRVTAAFQFLESHVAFRMAALPG